MDHTSGHLTRQINSDANSAALHLHRLFAAFGRKNMSYPRLFSLKCPDGWTASTDFLSGKYLTDDPPFGLLWEELGEDLIFVSDDNSGFGIDLGWYPDDSPSGEFVLEVVELKRLAETYANPIREFHTRSIDSQNLYKYSLAFRVYSSPFNSITSYAHASEATSRSLGARVQCWFLFKWE